MNAAIASFERHDFTPALNQLEAFQNKVRAQIGPDDPQLAAQLVSEAQAIIDAVRFPTGSGRGGGSSSMNITSVLRKSDGHVKLTFPGRSGRVYLIQASTDLRNWQSIGTGRHVELDTFEFEDANASPLQHRYYRIVEP